MDTTILSRIIPKNKFSELSFKNKLIWLVVNCRDSNRFFPIKNHEMVLDELLEHGEKKVINKHEALFRARSHNELDNYNKEAPLDFEYANPPKAEHNTGGRFNSSGISCLYLATKFETAIYETRPSIYSYVTVFEGFPKRPITVLDFSKYVPMLNMLLTQSLNKEDIELKNFIRFLLSIPVEPKLNSIMYAPTQLIAAYVKSKGFDGLSYASSIKNDGENVVLFDTGVVEFSNCIRRVFKINDINYGISEKGIELNNHTRPR